MIGEGSGTVLLVEDNRGDVGLVERAFESRELPATLHAVETGDEALDWIAGRGAFADESRPDLVLLDLNLPATTGQEVLDSLAEDPQTHKLPVVVLTSSKSQQEIREAYAGAANACVIKPVDPEAFADRVEAVVRFWLDTAELPTSATSGRP